jgi:competence protein ComEC
VVVRVSVDGGRRVLFPGDLDAASEARLVVAQAELGADIVLLAHHGSRGSNSPAFLDATSASWAIASAPCRSRFGMPHPEVRNRLVERAIPLAWTGRDGALLAPLRGSLRVFGTGKPAACP